MLCALIYAERRDEARQVIETFIDAARWHADLDIETPLPSTGEAERMAARDRIAWMLGSTGKGWRGKSRGGAGMTAATLTTEYADTIREVVSSVAASFEDCCGTYGGETAERFEELSRASVAFAALLRLADGQSQTITPLMLKLVGKGLAGQIECLRDYGPDDEYHDTQADCVDRIWRLLEHLEAS